MDKERYLQINAATDERAGEKTKNNSKDTKETKKIINKK